MGFTRMAVGAAAIAIEAHAPSALRLGPHIVASGSLGTIDLSHARQEPLIVASGSLAAASSTVGQQPSLPHVISSAPPIAIAERYMGTRSLNIRAFAEQVDTAIKANSATQVIPSDEAIAEEVLRQQKHRRTQHHGTGVSRELWTEHRNEADMVRDAGLAYRDIDNNGREIFCPICLAYCIVNNMLPSPST
jgi:hypothetical protein